MEQLLFSLVPIVIFTVVFKLKNYKLNNVSNFVFWGVLSVVFVYFFVPFISIFEFLRDSNNFIVLFVGNIFTAGIPEELSKYLAIKLSKPKTKTQVLVNAVYITLIFACLESYMYSSGADSFAVGLFRMLKPMHVFYGSVMAYFIMMGMNNKEKKNLYNVFAVLIPILLHSFSNAINGFSVNDPKSLVFAAIWSIFAYILPIIFIIKHVPDEEKYDNNKLKSIIKLVFVVPFLFIILVGYNSSNNEIKYGSSCYIKDKDFEMKVIDVKEENVTDTMFDYYNGLYTKVTLEVYNKSSNVLSLSLFDFRIIGTYEEEVDVLPLISTINVVQANSKSTIVLYFDKKYKKTDKLIYEERLKIKSTSCVFSLSN